MKWQAGDWVEIRSKEEIFRTLDGNGQLENLPFMPEMFQFCGKRLRIAKRAHKTCDTVNKTGARRMLSTVHLEGLRCDGTAHGGCEARCLLFWKHAWLRPVDARGDAPENAGVHQCTEEQVIAGTRAPGSTGEEDSTYVCQATQVPAATLPLKRTDMSQYWEDYSSGNISLGRLVAGFLFISYCKVMNLGIGLGRPMRWLYDAFQNLVGGTPYPYRPGEIPAGSRTPSMELNLQLGEWVRVKSHTEILKTLDVYGFNRGMLFNQELVPYCGKTYRVAGKVTRIINEKTGKMLPMKNSCIILEGVECEARYIDRQLFCPRGIYHYWREIWLERVDKPGCAVVAGGRCPLVETKP